MTSFQSYPKHPPLPPPKPYEPSRRMPQDSPTQPAHQNQLHFPSADSIPAPPAGNPQPRPPMSHQTHSRSSSFFSFLSTKNSQDPQNQHQPSPHRKLSRNTSASASGTRQNAMPQTQHQQQQSHQLQHPPPPMPQQQPSTTTAAPNSPSIPGASPSPKSPSSSPLHPEIRSLVSLTIAHAHKIYFSGPLIRRIERQPDGQKPVKDDGWTEVWAQLGGTTLSIWDMKEIQEASQKGEEVPPAYINITDAFVQVLGSVTVPATATQPSKRYTNVLTLNTAGSNLLLFSCPTTASLISWASALRLSAWEKSRLEEIYTAHLIRITLNRPNASTTLVNGKLEGWVRIRVAGQTDWKRVWMVVGAGHEGVVAGAAATSGTPPPSVQHKKKRMSNLFSRDQSPTRASSGPSKPIISMFIGPKPKEKKKVLLSVKDISQAFAVYPERPELISRSPLIKLEGLLGDEELAQSMKAREGWVLFMPEIEGATGNQAVEMLKWVIAVHDAFELYGRPTGWTWDPREPTSLMFAYPVGPQKDLLFLDREAVEVLDPRDDRTSATRSKLSELLSERMRQQQPQLVQQRPIASRTSSEQPPMLPPANGSSSSGPQLPPLSFSRTQTQERVLTPITEGGSTVTHGRGMSLDAVTASPVVANQLSQAPPTPSQTAQGKPASPVAVLDRGLSNSPTPANHAPTASTSNNPPVTPAETRPSVQPSISSSTSFDTPSRGADQKQPPASVSSPPQMKLDAASRGSTPVTEKNVASGRSNNLTVVPSPGGALVSPYSPIRSPVGLALSDSASSAPPKSPSASLMTSPYSHHDHAQADRMSVLTSPHSVYEAEEEKNSRDYLPLQLSSPKSMASTTATAQPVPKSPTSIPSKPAGKTHEPEDNFLSEAGALYFMRQSQIESGGSGLSNKPRQVPMPKSSDEDEDEESDSSEEFIKPNETTGTASAAINNTRTTPARQGTPMAFMERASTSSLPYASTSTSPGPPGPSSPTTAAMAPPVVAPLRMNISPGSDRGNVSTTGSVPLSATATSSRVGLGRKPSGARAQATSRTPYNSAGISASHLLTEEEETGDDDYSSNNNNNEQQKMQSSFTSTSNRATVQPARNQVPLSSPTPSQPKTPAFVKNLEEQEEVGEADEDVLAALSYLNVADEGSSSAKGGGGSGRVVEPLKVATQDRLGGGVAAGERPPLSASSASDSAAGPQFKSSFAPSTSAAKRKAKAQAQQAAHQAAVHKPGRANGRKSKAAGGWNDSTDEEEEEEEEEDDDDDDEDADSDGKVLPPRMQQNAPARPSVYGQLAGDGPQMRPPRTLPQPPIARAGTDDQHNLTGRRTYYDDGTQIRTQADFPPPGAARQTVWSQVLEPGKSVNPSEHPQKDTFVQLDTSETMTKAFTPQGLLSAGLQDKQDRSAKRQEEHARETGASLINVPNKPPPPQTGLLGAITAHERERKREGGVGAALTEREREKRLAEERQRRFDDQQRQQLEQMQQGGSMYGGYGFNPMMNPMMMGMNPMMMNPMMGGGLSPVMTGGGMNPMMTGGGMNPMMTGGGMNPMMGYPNMLTPQQMFAAQQAAAAAYQQAMMTFSVAGSQVGGDGGGNQPGNMPMGPNMTGGNMSGFDPRMSMMGMPMMGGMGMGMGMGMTPTMTGNFDSRPPPGVGGENGGLIPPGGHNQFSSQTSSPVGRGSPLARPADSSERPATPKH